MNAYKNPNDYAAESIVGTTSPDPLKPGRINIGIFVSHLDQKDRLWVPKKFLDNSGHRYAPLNYLVVSDRNTVTGDPRLGVYLSKDPLDVLADMIFREIELRIFSGKWNIEPVFEGIGTVSERGLIKPYGTTNSFRETIGVTSYRLNNIFWFGKGKRFDVYPIETRELIESMRKNELEKICQRSRKS